MQLNINSQTQSHGKQKGKKINLKPNITLKFKLICFHG